jgi:hypothetical protein
LLLQEYVACNDAHRAEALLETLVAEHASPSIHKIVRGKLAVHPGTDAPDVEDVSSRVVLDLHSRLRGIKTKSAPSIGPFSGYTTAAACHACDEYLRRKRPDRRRLKTRLRYLLNTEKSLAIWEGEAAEWLTGFSRWQSERPAPVTRERLDGWRDTLADVPRGKGGSHPANLASAIFERFGGPIPFDELAGIVAGIWGVDDAPAAPESAARAGLPAHLTYADTVACSEGHGAPHQIAHIRQCAACQGEVQDLSRFRTELVETPRRPIEPPRKPWAPHRVALGIAAAVLVIAGGAFIAMQRTRRVSPVQTAARAPQADPAIPAAEREILQRAIASGRLDRAPVLDRLIAKRAALLNPNATKPPIELLAPVGTTVLSDRPVLRWTPGGNATSYVVAIFDETRQKIVESPALIFTDWQPPSALPRGKVLTWQVTIRTAAGIVQAPAPPDPDARFQIVEPAVVERIETIRREFPGNPLLLAALHAHAGALDAAESLLKSMDPAASQRFRESLHRIRVPE